MKHNRDLGFTLVELLVVIAIIGMLLAVTLPAVNMARESARNTQCRNNLRQLALAVNTYAQQDDETLPPYWATANLWPWENFSWRTSILPFIDQTAVHDRILLEALPLDPVNYQNASTVIPTFQCPSTPGSPRRVQQLGIETTALPPPGMGASDYVGVFEVQTPSRVYPLRGAFNGGPDLEQIMESPADRLNPGPNQDFSGPPLEASDELTPSLRVKRGSFRRIRDGLSRTILMVEQAGKPKLYSSESEEPHDPKEGAWATSDYGTFNQSRVNWDNHSGPYSFHRAVNFAMCDGSVHSIVEGSDEAIITALMSMDGAEIINDDDWQ